MDECICSCSMLGTQKNQGQTWVVLCLWMNEIWNSGQRPRAWTSKVIQCKKCLRTKTGLETERSINYLVSIGLRIPMGVIVMACKTGLTHNPLEECWPSRPCYSCRLFKLKKLDWDMGTDFLPEVFDYLEAKASRVGMGWWLAYLNYNAQRNMHTQKDPAFQREDASEPTLILRMTDDPFNSYLMTQRPRLTPHTDSFAFFMDV